MNTWAVDKFCSNLNLKDINKVDYRHAQIYA